MFSNWTRIIFSFFSQDCTCVDWRSPSNRSKLRSHPSLVSFHLRMQLKRSQHRLRRWKLALKFDAWTSFSKELLRAFFWPLRSTFATLRLFEEQFEAIILEILSSSRQAWGLSPKNDILQRSHLTKNAGKSFTILMNWVK